MAIYKSDLPNLEDKLMDYGITHQGQVVTPNQTAGVSPEDNQARNKAIEQAELDHWKTQPDRMTAYYDFPNHPEGTRMPYRISFYPSNTGAKVTTWLGTTLGDIVSAKVYRHNFGFRMVSITVRATNGACYYGRASWDNGDVINLRKGKG